MADVREIVTDALVDIGVLAAGETANARHADSAFRALNRLVDAWALQELLIFTTTRTLKALTANDGSYTIGTGGDINIPRPIYIDEIRLVDTSVTPNTERPLHRLTNDGYASITQKALTAPDPTHWFYDYAWSSGLGNIVLWPVLTNSARSIALYVPTAPIAEFSSLSTTISLPPGYRRMLVKNLALEIAPSYRVPVTPELKEQASESVADVKRGNIRLEEVASPASMLFQAGAGAYDIRSDGFTR